jgi:hypothetical protein
LIRYEDLPLRGGRRQRRPDQLPGLRSIRRSNSGGTQRDALNILEGFDLKKLGHNTPQYLHVLTEAFAGVCRPVSISLTAFRAGRSHPAVA